MSADQFEDGATYRRIRSGLVEAPILCPQCAELIRVEKCHDAPRSLRWLAFCPECRAADPNGYATLREALRAVPGYWGGSLE